MTDRNSHPEFLESATAAHLAAIVESSVDAIISKNLSGTILSWNKAAERMYGYTCAEAIGQPITMLIPEDRLSEETTIIEKLKRKEGVDHFETIRKRKDGSLVNVSLTISPIVDASGKVIAASKSARDITDQKRIEADLRTLTLELDQRVAQRTQALTASQERLRGLATQLSLSEERARRKVASELHDYLGQMLVLCRLKLTQASQGTKESRTAQLLLEADRNLLDAISYTRSLVAQLTPPMLKEFGLVMGLTWLADQMKKHGLAVSLKLGVASVEVEEEHAILLFQSVRELLMNVVKHARSTEAMLTVSVTPEEILKLTVTDQGAGFDNAREQPIADTRFGLFSIRERMEAVGGIFEITSRPNEGTTATLSFSLSHNKPLSGNFSATVASPVLATTPAITQAVRILMVDDHPLVRKGMRSVVESFDTHTRGGRSGERTGSGATD